MQEVEFPESVFKSLLISFKAEFRLHFASYLYVYPCGFCRAAIKSMKELNDPAFHNAQCPLPEALAWLYTRESISEAYKDI